MTISLTRTTDGTVSNANANLNNNWSSLEAEINGNLTDANIKATAAMLGKPDSRRRLLMSVALGPWLRPVPPLPTLQPAGTSWNPLFAAYLADDLELLNHNR
jgi:hypothetical protein